MLLRVVATEVSSDLNSDAKVSLKSFAFMFQALEPRGGLSILSAKETTLERGRYSARAESYDTRAELASRAFRLRTERIRKGERLIFSVCARRT